MKVIVVGFCQTKTTRTVTEALRQLEFKVHGYEEDVYVNGDQWMKILGNGGTRKDFRKLYEGVDAVIDLPGSYFWEEILDAFPEAKIILMQQGNEDTWVKAMKRQVETVSSRWMLSHLFCLSPTKNKVHRLGATIGRTVFGRSLYEPWPFNCDVNEMLLRKAYRSQHAHVLQCAPKEKLLIYRIRDGWEPLCRFLDRKVPNSEFPERNCDRDIIIQMLTRSPMMQTMKKEVFISLSLIAIASSILMYYIV